MTDAVGQSERIDPLAAVKHDVGKPGSAKEHADHRFDAGFPARQCDQLAGDKVRCQVGAGDRQQLVERFDRVAARTKIERNEIGLPAGQYGNRRSAGAEMAAIVKLGQNRLDRAVAAIDGQHGRLDAGDGPHRLADLIGFLHLIVKDVGMFGAKGADAAATGRYCQSTWDC